MNFKALWLAASLASAAAVPLSHAATELLDQVIAIVDEDVIMASELRERLAAVTESLNARGVELPPEAHIGDNRLSAGISI